MGAGLKAGLQQLETDFKGVTNVRGAGLLVAMDLPDGETRDRVWQGCWDRGLAVLSCGPRSIRLRPPLVFSKEHASMALGTLREVLNEPSTDSTQRRYV